MTAPADDVTTSGGDSVAGNWLRQYPFEDVASAFTVSVGEVLRLSRETRGLSRVELVEQLAWAIGHRTLISYENGSRHPNLERLLDLCITLGISMPDAVEQALSRTREILEPELPAMAAEPDIAGDDIADNDVVEAGQAFAAEAETTAEPVRRWYATATNSQADDELTRLRAECEQQRKRAEHNLERAQAAEERARSLTEQLAAAAIDDREAAATAAHEAEIKQLRKEHRAEVRELKKNARQERARILDQHAKQVQELRREHAYRMEQLVAQRSPGSDTDTGSVSATTLAGATVYEPNISI